MVKYQIIKQLGSGSFGSVFEAIYNGRRVCIKKINFVDGLSLEAAQQEVRVWCNLNHPNIVKYIQSFIEQNQFCIVMELVEGFSLDQFLVNTCNLSESIVVNLFRQILSAIKYCHLNQVLHRDIKPQNLLLTKEYQIKLADFGISRVVEEYRNSAKTQIGTPYYMAPEILNHELYGFPADIWSLGCVLYEMVTRKRPFPNDYVQFFQQILYGNPFPIQCNCSQNLKSLIFCMLKKNPSQRISIHQIENLPFILALNNVTNQQTPQHQNDFSNQQSNFSQAHSPSINYNPVSSQFSQTPSIYPNLSSQFPHPENPYQSNFDSTQNSNQTQFQYPINTYQPQFPSS
jgi:NIMA (never in mitosis gene a)-related kinase